VDLHASRHGGKLFLKADEADRRAVGVEPCGAAARRQPFLRAARSAMVTEAANRYSTLITPSIAGNEQH
jgi:hypothetical protein